jgi:hypothetical protein
MMAWRLTQTLAKNPQKNKKNRNAHLRRVVWCLSLTFLVFLLLVLSYRSFLYHTGVPTVE